jgi:DNA-binding XRE family transcriptional regulator
VEPARPSVSAALHITLTPLYRVRYNSDMKVGPVIRRLREERALSQTALARRAGISRITLVRIEGDAQDPTLGTLERIAQALKVRVRDVFPPEGRAVKARHPRTGIR